MAGVINPDRTSLAQGVPARHIGPETGSSGNATVTNDGGTSEGTNEAADSRPAGASGFEDGVESPSGFDEERSFTGAHEDSRRSHVQAPLKPELEAAARQIADGADRLHTDVQEELDEDFDLED